MTQPYQITDYSQWSLSSLKGPQKLSEEHTQGLHARQCSFRTAMHLAAQLAPENQQVDINLIYKSSCEIIDDQLEINQESPL